MDAKQLRIEIVRPALKSIDKWSEAAENLLMGTAAVESRLHAVRQYGDGPALSLFQIEPATHDDIWRHFLAYNRPLAQSIRLSIQTDYLRPPASRLIWDIRYSALMARLQYLRRPDPLPDPNDVWALGQYWKDHFNTHRGKGTVESFVSSYALTQG